jgi:glutathione S-transferase
MMKLYGFPPSPNTWKVRALADHIGAPVEFALVDISKGEQRKPEYLAINPTGRTPALVDGDVKVWESTAILQYIAASKPNDVWPKDAATRASIMQWQSWQLQHWSQACEPMLFERVVKPALGLGKTDAARLTQAEAAFQKEGTVLNAHLANRSHLVGDRLTLADFSVASYLFHAEKAAMPLAAYPNVARWFADVSKLPCWGRTAPKM